MTGTSYLMVSQIVGGVDGAVSKSRLRAGECHVPVVNKKDAGAQRDPFCDPDVIKKQYWMESESFKVLFNSKALTAGHSLIITKRHALGLLDLDADEARELMAVLNASLNVVLKEYNNNERNYDLKIRSGEFSGRTVNHFHLHIIPRRKVPGPDGNYWYENIYEKSLRQIDRPFLDDIREDVKRLRRGARGIVLDKEPAGSGTLGNGVLARPLRDAVFYESEGFIVAYNPAPLVRGQALIIPRREIKDISELNANEVSDLIGTYVVSMRALLKAYGEGSRSYITSMQVGGYARMPTDRMHIHLIPRSRNDVYSGRDDYMYFDMYESDKKGAVMTGKEVSEEVKRLKLLIRSR